MSRSFMVVKSCQANLALLIVALSVGFIAVISGDALHPNHCAPRSHPLDMRKAAAHIKSLRSEPLQ